MALSVRSSILTSFLILAFALPLAWAQHGPVRPVGGGGMHISSSPISHAPAYHGPTYSPSPRYSGFTPRGGTFNTGFGRPIRPIRPFPPTVIIYYPLILGPAPFWQFNSCWWASCDLFWTLGSVMVPYYQYSPPNYVVEPPLYEAPVYGEESRDLPQLYLKDGSILSVTDYWVINDRLHFTMIEAEGAKPVEHDIPFDQLDLQKTIDANTARGFNFMLRNEPVEQSVRDHPDKPPADATPPHD